MLNAMITMILGLALVAGACAADVAESDEYEALANELATVQQRLSDTEAELHAATTSMDTAARDAYDQLASP